MCLPVGVHRPDVPECLRAEAAIRTRCREVFPQSPRPQIRLFSSDGSDDESLRGGNEMFRETAADSGGAVAQGRRKDEVMKEHLARFDKREGVVFIGKAQEKTPVFRTEKLRN